MVTYLLIYLLTYFLRTPTPIKEVINYDYAIESEKRIRHSYDKFLDEVKN